MYVSLAIKPRVANDRSDTGFGNRTNATGFIAAYEPHLNTGCQKWHKTGLGFSCRDNGENFNRPTPSDVGNVYSVVQNYESGARFCNAQMIYARVDSARL